MLIVHFALSGALAFFRRRVSNLELQSSSLFNNIIATVVRLSNKTGTTKSYDDDDDDGDDDDHHHIYGATFCPVALYGTL